MRGKPLFPFAGIAVVALALMIGLSFIGVHQKEAILAGDADGGQTPATDVDTSDPMALGEQVYQASCVHCHGGNFEGMGVNLNGLADRYSKEEVLDIVQNGIPGTSMPGNLVPDADSRDAVAEYLLEVTK